MDTGSIHQRSLMAPTEFHFFTELPIEIRLQIWHLALPEPRIIEITYPASPSNNRTQLRSRCPPPTLLGICSESREECLTRYSLLKLNRQGAPGDDEYIPINYEQDTLFFNFSVAERPLDMDGWMGALEDDEGERDKIRHLAFRFHTTPYGGMCQVRWPDNFMCYQWLREFRRLRLWVVVMGEDAAPNSGGKVEFLSYDTARARNVKMSVMKEVEIARMRYFDADWAAPMVKTFKICRDSGRAKANSKEAACRKSLDSTHDHHISCDL